MREFSSCGYFEYRGCFPGGWAGVGQCPNPASFTGAGQDGRVAVACVEHRSMLQHPVEIPIYVDFDGETLERAAENQADLERLLSEPTRGL